MVLRERLRPGDTVLVGGKLPEGITADDLAALCELIHSLGAEVTLDTAAVRPAQVERIRPLVMKPNRLELGEITGLPVERLEDCVAAARLLLRHGAERVLVSLDRDGAFLLDREGLLLARARRWRCAARWAPAMPCWRGSQRHCSPVCPGRRPCAGLWRQGARPVCTMAPMRRPGRRPKLCCPGWGLTLPGTFRTDRAYTVPSGDSNPR